MTSGQDYSADAPTREAIDATRGPLVIEFGTGWCGVCQGAQPAIAAAFERHPGLPHLKIEDGPGRALGRSFKVKLWPTLIVLLDGQEVARVVRPRDVSAIDEALAQAGTSGYTAKAP